MKIVPPAAKDPMEDIIKSEEFFNRLKPNNPSGKLLINIAITKRRLTPSPLVKLTPIMVDSGIASIIVPINIASPEEFSGLFCALFRDLPQ